MIPCTDKKSTVWWSTFINTSWTPRLQEVYRRETDAHLLCTAITLCCYRWVAERMKPSSVIPGSPDLFLPLDDLLSIKASLSHHTSTQTHRVQGSHTPGEGWGASKGVHLYFTQSTLKWFQVCCGETVNILLLWLPLFHFLPSLLSSCSPSRLPLSSSSRHAASFQSLPSVTGIVTVKKGE